VSCYRVEIIKSKIPLRNMFCGKNSSASCDASRSLEMSMKNCGIYEKLLGLLCSEISAARLAVAFRRSRLIVGGLKVK